MRYLDGQVPVLEGVKPDQIPFDQLFAAEGPIILRGLAPARGLADQPDKCLGWCIRYSGLQ